MSNWWLTNYFVNRDRDPEEVKGVKLGERGGHWPNSDFVFCQTSIKVTVL